MQIFVCKSYVCLLTKTAPFFILCLSLSGSDNNFEASLVFSKFETYSLHFHAVHIFARIRRDLLRILFYARCILNTNPYLWDRHGLSFSQSFPTSGLDVLLDLPSASRPHKLLITIVNLCAKM